MRRATGRGWTILVMIMLGLTSCSPQPLRDGPQIGKPPRGFMYDGNASAARLIFPELEMTRQRGYFTMTEPHNSIMITQCKGSVENSKIRAAKESAERKYEWLRYSEIEELYIDQRPAVAWTETQFYKGEIWTLEYCAVVPYDDATYTVEFYATDPEMRNHEYLREVVSTFLVAE